MGLRQVDSEGRGGYARIWSVENKGKYSLANISTSKKVKDEDRYETDFQDGYVRLIGSAHEKAKTLDCSNNGVLVQIKSLEVTSRYDADKKTKYTNFLVYAFDVCDGNSTNTKAKKEKVNKDSAAVERAIVEEQENLPF